MLCSIPVLHSSANLSDSEATLSFALDAYTRSTGGSPSYFQSW